MRELVPKFEQANITPVLVVQARPDQVLESTGPLEGVVVVPDPRRLSHRMLGLKRMSFWKLFSLSALRDARKRAQASGHAQDWSLTFTKESDSMLNPGAVFVDRSGIVRWIHRGQHVADLPSVESLLSTAMGLGASTDDLE